MKTDFLYKIILFTLLLSLSISENRDNIFYSIKNAPKHLLLKNISTSQNSEKNTHIQTRKFRFINKQNLIRHKFIADIPEISVFGYKLKSPNIKNYNREVFRNTVILLSFECIEGLNEGSSYLVSATFDEGQYSTGSEFNWDYSDYVCVTAQKCLTQYGNICSDIVGPVCAYAGSNDEILDCININNCEDQILGDSNNDNAVNVLDIVIIVNYILTGNIDFDNCNVIVSDFNQDSELNVLDVVEIINTILSETTH